MFDGVTLPFTPAELLTSGVSLLGIVGTFVLLGLAFSVVPKLVGLITGAFRQGAGGK